MKKDANIETYKIRGGYKGPLPQGQPGFAGSNPFANIPAIAEASVEGKFDKLRKQARTARGGDVPKSLRVNKYSKELGLRKIRNAREDNYRQVGTGGTRMADAPPKINPRKAYED